MSDTDDGKISTTLKALLEGQRLNRKDFNNASLHSWTSTIRNECFIPVESVKSSDGTCDYFMLPEEIERFKDPSLRSEQQNEMRAIVARERQEKLIQDFIRFLINLADFPVLWSYWCELPFQLSEISMKINVLLDEDSVNQ